MRVTPDTDVIALNMPFADNSFDGVTCSGVLQHLKESARALARTPPGE